jgi:hypothetical protein
MMIHDTLRQPFYSKYHLAYLLMGKHLLIREYLEYRYSSLRRSPRTRLSKAPSAVSVSLNDPDGSTGLSHQFCLAFSGENA